MKRILNKLFVAVCAAGALSGCINEDYSMCPPDEVIVNPNQDVTEVLMLRAKDKGNGMTDITMTGAVTDATLVFFDANNNYLTSMTIPGDRLMEDIAIPEELKDYQGKAFVSAWGNVADGSVMTTTDFTGTNYTTSRFLDMANDPTHTGYHIPPGETFFGTQEITLGGLTPAEQQATRQATVVRRQQIDITQKNAQLSLTVRGLPNPGPEQDYYIVASNLRDGYTFSGTAINDPDELRAQTSVRRQKAVFKPNGDLVSPTPITLIHQNNPDAVSDQTTVKLELFKVSADGGADVNLGGQIMTNMFGENIPLYSGQQTNVLIYFTGENGGCECPTSPVMVQVEVIDWGEIHQWTILDF